MDGRWVLTGTPTRHSTNPTPIITCDVDGVVTKHGTCRRVYAWTVFKLVKHKGLRYRLLRWINLNAPLNTKVIDTLKILEEKYHIVFVTSRKPIHNYITSVLLNHAFGDNHVLYCMGSIASKVGKINMLAPAFHIDDVEAVCRDLAVPYLIVR